MNVPDKPVANPWSPPRPGAWLPRDLSWRRDLAVPAVILILQCSGAAAMARHPHHGHLDHLDALDWALLVVGPVALLAWRRHPVAVLWVTFAATLAPSGSALAYVSLVVAFFVAATTGHRRAAWLVVALGFAYAIWLLPLASGRSVPSFSSWLALAAWLAFLVVAAEAWRMRHERAAEARAARQVEQRRRQSEERLQMARDLHDVIGHTISLINVQAGVGLDLMDGRPEQARTALTAIKAASKDALEELRTMLVALRRDDEHAPRSPAPGLDRLPELLELTRAAGFPVHAEVRGEQRALPPAVDLAAYRIIQESLTNVARHAGRASAVVRLAYTTGELRIEIVDDGRATVPAHPGPAGTGSGIDGMRQRALALGGRLDAAPRPGGGFAVTAVLPLAGDR